MPFAHGARAGASLDRHTVDAHTFAHGARARFTLDTHTWEPRGSFLLAGAALQALDGARVSGPPPLMLPGAALGSLAARFCWQGQHFRLWTVPERVSGPPPLMLPGAALGSLAARFCCSGSGRYPSAFRGPPLDAAMGAWRLTWEPRGDAARRSTWEPRGSFLLAGAALQALDGTRARFGAPALMLPGGALGSLAARFCWQGQHFRLWTVPERVSGPTRSLTVPERVSH